MITHSIWGGTGSGFTSLLLERLSVDYEKISILGFTHLPSPKLSSSPIEPYNAVLSVYALENHLNSTVIFDNESLIRISSRYLGNNNPSYQDVNRLIAQSISSVTCSFRFRSCSSQSIKELSTNLVPYTNVKFILPSFAPFNWTKDGEISEVSVSEMTKSVFEKDSMMISWNPRHGKYMSWSLFYKGDVSSSEVKSEISNLKKDKTLHLVDWAPTGVKYAFNSQSPAVIPGSNLGKTNKSVCLLSNSIAMAEVLWKIDNKFDLWYCKRAFVHHYVGEGMEEGEFVEARENLAAIEKDLEMPSFEIEEGEME